jgi:hypothetical protein
MVGIVFDYNGTSGLVKGTRDQLTGSLLTRSRFFSRMMRIKSVVSSVWGSEEKVKKEVKQGPMKQLK